MPNIHALLPLYVYYLLSTPPNRLVRKGGGGGESVMSHGEAAVLEAKDPGTWVANIT